MDLLKEFRFLEEYLSVDGLSVDVCLSTDKLFIDGFGLSIYELGLSIDEITSTNIDFPCEHSSSSLSMTYPICSFSN